jgi:predicted O-linked N-acetylglucosamine transferase (SPINDLY family)
MIDSDRQVQSALRDAHLRHREGRLDVARTLCLQVLRLRPRQLEALNLLGIIAAQTGDLRRAAELFGEVLRLDPRGIAALLNHGNVLRAIKQPAAALASFDKAIKIQPRHAPSHHQRGNALFELKRYEAALASFDKAIRIQPGHAPIHHDRGNALFELKQYEAAVASHEKAIALKHDYAMAYYERARALVALMRYRAAIESLDGTIALDPNYAGAWVLRGNALHAVERFEAALESYDRAIALRSDDANAYLNRGITLTLLGRLESAIESYNRGIALKPDDANAYHNRGNTLTLLGQPESAIESYDQAIALEPNRRSTCGARLYARMQIADWYDFAPEVAQLTARIERGEAASNPFAVLAFIGNAALQKQAAQSWVREKCPPDTALGPLPKRSRRDKIRIGYFSADFRSHATSYLTAGLFELHDRSKLELTAFSFGQDTKDEMRMRLEATFDRFLDVQRSSDHEIARLARDLEIDIAVDLGGFTSGSRPRIFALRSAPLQVSYLGCLGTMSADYMDYLIADDTIVPEAHQEYYHEKIVYLPSYQVNDSKRRIAEKRFSREELGLPSSGFVFCCFNATYKITPDVFDRWMRILKEVRGSVLYVLGGRESLEHNLQREAQARGVAPDRIVFGTRLPGPEYLARYRTADLFLDTLPYNAGTTASDALWAGLPVLTCLGESFAGRVGASLLQAVGLTELIAPTPERYEELAIDLASDPNSMAGIRMKLANNLRTAPLFDTASSARHLEAAYATMYERYHAGLPPEHIRVVHR